MTVGPARKLPPIINYTTPLNFLFYHYRCLLHRFFNSTLYYNVQPWLNFNKSETIIEEMKEPN